MKNQSQNLNLTKPDKTWIIQVFDEVLLAVVHVMKCSASPRHNQETEIQGEEKSIFRVFDCEADKA